MMETFPFVHVSLCTVQVIVRVMRMRLDVLFHLIELFLDVFLRFMVLFLRGRIWLVNVLPCDFLRCVVSFDRQNFVVDQVVAVVMSAVPRVVILVVFIRFVVSLVPSMMQNRLLKIGLLMVRVAMHSISMTDILMTDGHLLNLVNMVSMVAMGV